MLWTFCQKMRHLASNLLVLLLSASATLGDDIRHEVAIVSDPTADYLAICGWEFDVEGGGFSTCEIDLDGDGRKDQMFANAGTSGTGGQAATIYLSRGDGKFTRVGTLGHGAISAEKIKTGGSLLHCSWSFGGGATSITTYLISHDGLKEVMAIGGEWNDDEYKKRFEAVFAEPLKPHYKFVAARPKPKAEQTPEAIGQRK